MVYIGKKFRVFIFLKSILSIFRRVTKKWNKMALIIKNFKHNNNKSLSESYKLINWSFTGQIFEIWLFFAVASNSRKTAFNSIEFGLFLVHSYFISYLFFKTILYFLTDITSARVITCELFNNNGNYRIFFRSHLNPI